MLFINIHKILNNNVIVTFDDNGKELIVMGRGLAFAKQEGQKINAEAIEKMYTLKNEYESDTFNKLINEIPIEYLMVTGRIIDRAKLLLGRSLDEHLYVLLTEYIYASIKKTKLDIHTVNVLNPEIQGFFPDEYALGLFALEQIEKEFKVNLPEAEAGFIALHLFNAQLDGNLQEAQKITEMIKEILGIIRLFFEIPLRNESLYWFRFVSHLKYLSYKVLEGKEESRSAEEALFAAISKNKPEMKKCLAKIETYYLQDYHYQISSEDKLYLMIHLLKLDSKMNKLDKD